MAPSDSQRKILEAMQRLPNAGNSVAEIAAEVDEQAVTIGRDLRQMEAGMTPRPVQRTVDESRGEAVWFLTPAGEELLSGSDD